MAWHKTQKIYAVYLMSDYTLYIVFRQGNTKASEQPIPFRSFFKLCELPYNSSADDLFAVIAKTCACGNIIRTCLHKKCMRIFEHNFVADKAKIRRRAAARQGFLTQYAAKFAEKTCAYAYEDRF